jgi:hypothetical protein
MPDRATLKIFGLIVGSYLLLWLPAALWPDSGYLDTPFGWIAAIPVLSLYAFHAMGINGLLQNNGLCGWGWCAPSIVGWAFLATFWLAIAWLSAKALSGLRARSHGSRRESRAP